MQRYNDGLRTVFEMEKSLREAAFEVCLSMHYAMLDEFGGENPYRSLVWSTMLFLDEAGLPGSEGLAFLANTLSSRPGL